MSDREREFSTEGSHGSYDNALRRLQANGSDLSRPMEIVFVVLVPNAISGLEFAVVATELGYRVSVVLDEDAEHCTCLCSRTMLPSVVSLIECQSELDVQAKAYSGRIDGWESWGNAESQN